MAATEMRPPSRISRNCWKPCPRWPRRFPSGTRAVLEGQPAGVGGAPAELLHRGRDAVAQRAVGTTMFEISSSPVRAVIVTQAVMSVPALVMKIFDPFTTQWPSRRSARVCVAPASDRRPARSARTPPAARPRRDPAATRASAPRRRRGRSASSERRVRSDRDRDGRVDPRQLLDRDRVRERVAARAAVLLRDGKAQKPELRELGDELVGEAVLAVELLGDRRDLVARRSRRTVLRISSCRRRVRSSLGGQAWRELRSSRTP